MNLKQAIKQIEDKESQVIQLEKEIEDIKSKLIELTELKYGDKVKVTTKDWEKNIEKTICYISGCEYKGYAKDKIKYRFNKEKKDGTMSHQSAGIYHNNDTLIEKI